MRKNKTTVLQWIAALAAGLALFAGGPGQANAEPQRQQACYTLTLTVDGGPGSPLTASEPNCPDGQYAEGTVVTLTAHPDPGAFVYSWRGTADDATDALTNQVKMLRDREVGVTYGPLEVQVNAAAGTRVARGVLDSIQSEGRARVIIALRDPVSVFAASDVRRAAVAQVQNDVLDQLSLVNFELRYQYSHVPALAGVIDADALDALQTNPAVLMVQVDEPTQAHTGQSVPALDADDVHLMGITGSGVRVAVLDTGIDTDHADLSDDIAAQHCFTDAACPPSNTDESTSAEDDNGHGTNVSGVITGSGAVAPVGFAPDAEIVAIKVLSSTGGGWVSDWVAGLNWIIANQGTLSVDVVNMSLGTYTLYSSNCDSSLPTVATALSQINALGIVTFASTGNAGNSTSIGSPSCNSYVVGVGATYDSDLGREPNSGTYQDLFGGSWPACYDATTSLTTITCFTNSNSMTDVLAPGSQITSAYVGGGTATYRGTSQASPSAAGVAALMLETSPSLTPAQVESTMQSTGTLVTDPKNSLQFPLINALSAVLAVSAPANDDFDDATLIASTPYNDTMDTTAATTAGDDPIFTCTGGQKHHTVWYKYTPPGDEMLTVSTVGSDYDTVAAVWTGTRGSLTSQACNDDGGGSGTSLLSVAVYAGTTYYIEIAGWAVDEYGNLVLNVSSVPINDDFNNATPITTTPFSDTMDTTDGTTAGDDPVLSCVGGQGSHSVWYSYQPPQGEIVTVNTAGSSFDTVLAAWTGTRGSLSNVACNDNFSGSTSQIAFTAAAGTTYYIEVAGKTGADFGTLDLALSTSSATTNLVRNGDFASGTSEWSVWGGASASVNAGVMELTSTGAGSLFQDAGVAAVSGAPFEMQVDLGNSSAAAKEVQLLLHNPELTDVLSCQFALPSGAGLNTYILRGVTAMTWSDIRVEVVPLTYDGLSALRVDNVDVQYKPGLSLSGVECVVPEMPASLNVARNSAFASGEAQWNFYDMLGHSVSGGVLTFWDDDADNGVWQNTYYGLPTGAPMTVSVDLGNSSAAAKEVMVVLHDHDWSESMMCYAALPAGAPLATYGLQGPTTTAWDQVFVAVWDLTGNGLQGIQMDNVDVQYQPSLSLSGVECFVPEAPATLNLARNGDFANGESQWNAYDMLGHSVSGGVLTFWDDDTSNGMWQDTFYSLPSGAPMNASVELGNSSAAAKEVMVVLHDHDWSESLMCYFALPAGAPLATYTLQGPTTVAWDKTMVAVWDLTGNGLQGIQMDNVDVQYQPSLSLSGVECLAADAPANVNLTRNGDFASGESQWNAYDMLGHSVSGGVLTFWDDDTSNGMWQDTFYGLPSGAPMNASVDLGNSSAAAKEVMVVLHDHDWSESLMCYFALPAGAPLATYTMQGPTTVAWDKTMVAVWDLTGNGLQGIQMDNVDVQYQPSLSLSGVECFVPEAPATLNLARNGDFANGESQWNAYDMLGHSVSGGVLTFWDDDTSNGMWQDTFYGLPSGAPMDASVELGNSSAAAKEVMVVLHDHDWSESLMCYFALPAGAPLATYTLQGPTTVAWDKTMVAVWDLTGNGLAGIRMDNVDVQYQPSLSLSGVTCGIPEMPANLNVARNGAFTNGESQWNFFDMLGHSVSGGVLTFWDDDTSNSAWQDTFYSLPSGAPVTALLDLGNSSAAAKDVAVVLHAQDWSQSMRCDFTLPAGATLDTYSLQGPTTAAWPNVVLDVWDLTGDGLEGIRMDNVDVQYQPSLSLSGVTCDVPATGPGGTDLSPVPEPQPVDTMVLEAESGHVTLTGEWTAHATELASGGAYVYSSGSIEDTLSLSFSGTYLAVTYVQHPVLGVFTVEVDGAVMQTVDSVAADAVFGTRVEITGLSAGEHVARIVPVEGTIAIDAFVVEAQPEPAVEPTPVPTEIVPLDTPTPEPSVELTTEPTATPEPVETLETVESDDTRVAQTGLWTLTPSELASGGAYLFNGDVKDTLALAFTGPRLDVVYVKHPALGTFTIEVDGAVLYTVNSAGEQNVFGAVVALNGLGDGAHTLRIAPVSGTIAIDAFVVAPQDEVPPVVPTVDPTVEPTVEPTVAPTEPEPTDVPPTATPEPTDVPPVETPTGPSKPGLGS